MSFREAWPAILVATTLAAVATIAACGSAAVNPGASCTPASGQACAVDASVADSGALASPPPPGPMQPPDGTTPVTFAMSTILWGDTDPDGGLDPTDGWKQYGYNLDGVPPGNAAAFCQPVPGASASLVHEEGVDGIENAFGHLVVPLFDSMQSQCSYCQNICCGINQSFTILLSLDQLGTGTSTNPLSARVATGTDLDVDAGAICGIALPRFDGTDVWSVLSGTSGALSGSYLVHDTWVSGPIASVSVVFRGFCPDEEYVLPLDIVHARITMQLDPAHRTATAGVIAGVIPTADLQRSLMTLWASQFTSPTSECNNPVIQNLLVSIAQASDIMQDGTQDPARTCDAISIGLGFTASVDQLGPTLPPVTAPDPCAGDAASGD